MKTTHFYRRVHFSVIEIEQDWQHNKIVIPLKLPVSKGEQCDLGLRSQKKKITSKKCHLEEKKKTGELNHTFQDTSVVMNKCNYYDT